MAITKLVSDNEEKIKNAAIDGISADAIEATLEDVINVSNTKGKVPTQVKDTIEAIVEMKKDIQNIKDEQYASNFVKENNQKITSALNEGISANEIAVTLVNSTNNSNTKQGKKHLKFIVNLISKMKKKELKLAKDKANTNINTKQMVYVKQQ